jgi:hypothetical protein
MRTPIERLARPGGSELGRPLIGDDHCKRRLNEGDSPLGGLYGSAQRENGSVRAAAADRAEAMMSRAAIPHRFRVNGIKRSLALPRSDRGQFVFKWGRGPCAVRSPRQSSRAARSHYLFVFVDCGDPARRRSREQGRDQTAGFCAPGRGAGPLTAMFGCAAAPLMRRAPSLRGRPGLTPRQSYDHREDALPPVSAILYTSGNAAAEIDRHAVLQVEVAV